MSCCSLSERNRKRTVNFTERNKLEEHSVPLRLQLHGAIHRPDSFVLILRYCANLKAISYESTTLNRIVADKSHRVIVALDFGTQKNSLKGAIACMMKEPGVLLRHNTTLFYRFSEDLSRG